MSPTTRLAVFVIIFNLLLACASLLAAYFLEKWSKQTQVRRRFTSIWAFFAFLGLSIIGAIGSTYYWNEFSREQETRLQRHAMIHVLATETFANLQVLDAQVFHEADEDSLNHFEVFPRFKTSALESAIGSGLFVALADRALYTRVYHLHTLLEDSNLRSELLEKQMLANPASIHLIRQLLTDPSALAPCRSALLQLAGLLRTNYGVAAADTFLVELHY
jgi:hypothetical protein